MRKVFTAELEALGDDLAAMGVLVQTAISDATSALLATNLVQAQAVISGDAQIDVAQVRVDERAVELLAREAPVARDLRSVVSALRVSATLERMGDLARHVAELARLRYPESAIPAELRIVFTDMCALAVKAGTNVAELLHTHDLSLAARIIAEDDQLDALHEETFRAMLGSKWAGEARHAVDVTLLGRYLERLGDHAVSVSRRIAYLVKGDIDALADVEF